MSFWVFLATFPFHVLAFFILFAPLLLLPRIVSLTLIYPGSSSFEYDSNLT